MPVDVERCIHTVFLRVVAPVGTTLLGVSVRNVSLTFGGESVLTLEKPR